MTNFAEKVAFDCYYNHIMKNLIRILLFSLLIFSVYSCAALKPKKVDTRKTPVSAMEKIKKNKEEGRGISLMGAMKGRGGNFEFASSNELWRASLDIIDFAPLSNVDYSGGVIVTDWFGKGNKNEELKITVRFLSNEIRIDGLDVIIFKKTCDANNNCIVNKINNETNFKIKRKILERATLLKKNKLKEIGEYKLPSTD